MVKKLSNSTEESKIQKDVVAKKLKAEADKYMKEDVELQKLRELRLRNVHPKQRFPLDEE